MPNPSVHAMTYTVTSALRSTLNGGLAVLTVNYRGFESLR